MGILKTVFPWLKSDVRLSSVLPTKSLALLAFAWSAGYLFMWPSANEWWAAVPFVMMATKGVDVTFLNGLFLSAIWISYMLFVTSPLYPLVGRYIILSAYLPIIGVVFYKQPHQPADPLFLFFETVFWDFPLMFWMRIISRMNGRALKPFYSQITADLAMGSMPLPVDAKYLSEIKSIGLVVNMCREYPGPLVEYASYGIRQVHLPTPDVCEPSYLDVLRGVHEIAEFLSAFQDQKSEELDKAVQGADGELETKADSSQTVCESSATATAPTTTIVPTTTTTTTTTNRGVFIHCKAGRGRAATLTLCYLLASTQLHPADAMRLIRSHRAVVEPSVRHYHVVRRFIQRLERYNCDFKALYLHDFVLRNED